MNEVVIVAAEAVSALGDNRSQTWHKLLAGESGTAPVTGFDPAPYYCRIAAGIKKLDSRPQAAGRLEHLLQLLFKNLPPTLPASCRLIGSTLKGAIDLQEKKWQQAAADGKPALPEEISPPAATAKLVAEHFSLNQPGLLINAACASSTVALNRAAGRIAAGFDDCILVWAAEIISEFVFAGFASIKALTPDCCRPFDKHRNGLILGEAAAALLLMSKEKAQQEGLKPLAEISGWGIANDAVHLTAPARDGRGLLKACRRALNRARLKPEAIAAINAHGTATIHNDEMEIAAFNHLFDNSATPKKIPLHSVKGALGHTLGAAGALETTIAVNSLQEQCLPPTMGLRQPETASCNRIEPQRQDFSGNHLLLTNSGFGGINAALILSKS